MEFLNGVIKELVADPANGLTIDIDAANRDEAKAKVKWLNKIAKAMKGEKQLELKLANEPSVEAEAALKARKHKSHKKKGGAKKPVASQPYNPDNIKKAVDAGQLGEAGKTVLEFQNKLAEFIKLQQALKAAGDEEEKNRLGAEIEKKKAEMEELQKKLEAGGGKG